MLLRSAQGLLHLSSPLPADIPPVTRQVLLDLQPLLLMLHLHVFLQQHVLLQRNKGTLLLLLLLQLNRDRDASRNLPPVLPEKKIFLKPARSCCRSSSSCKRRCLTGCCHRIISGAAGGGAAAAASPSFSALVALDFLNPPLSFPSLLRSTSFFFP